MASFSQSWYKEAPFISDTDYVRDGVLGRTDCGREASGSVKTTPSLLAVAMPLVLDTFGAVSLMDGPGQSTSCPEADPGPRSFPMEAV